MKVINEFKENNKTTGLELTNNEAVEMISKNSELIKKNRSLLDFSKIVESGEIVFGSASSKPFKSYLH
ncbi:hypothetical protein P4679_24085 [Priestia megaterium]|uniref:hypothetical protein n=1 Tax=Priestia megaterium TaxID=1404 RepID=UPI002E1AC39C|nr:hypothetical protein [Priestia megaterium]